ncbi:MAG: extracellular solute-binding protein [Chloroflexi bacterium]|nr:extracellular solute-binding protein [Chloroflexota bacterium]
MFRYRNSLIALIMVFSIVMATGCTPAVVTPVVEEPAAETPEVAATEAAPATEAPVFAPGTTITYIASQNWVLDSEMELAKKFEAETGVHVDFQIIPSDQYFNVLETKLEAGGEGIDIFGGQSGKTDIKLQLNVEKNAVPLTDEEWVKRMNPLSVEQISLDGVTYGLTIWDTIGGSWVIVYNKTIFAENGISVPKTYAEFAAACQTLQDAVIIPVYEPFADGWHHVLWFLEMGPVYEAATPGLADALNINKATFSGNPTMLTALTELKEMYDKGYFGDDALSNEFANTEAAMAEGKYAMTVNRFGLPSQIHTAFPDVDEDNFGYFLIPLADNQIWNVNPAAPSKFIYSGSKNIEAAKAYFEFLTRPENLQFMLDNEAQFTMLNFDGVKAELTADQQAFIDTYTEQGTVYQTAVNYVNPQWMDVGQVLTALLTGAVTPEDVLAEIDQRRTDMAVSAGDEAWK